MGSYFNDAVSLNPVGGVSTSQGLRFCKHIHDNLHGNIYLEPLFLKFIDTEQFQRLRDLKQLGVADKVFPGAVHTRFEHCLGVYQLAGQAVHLLEKFQGAELGIDAFDVKTVKLAGLLHDVGHGPFSHLFEREFLPRVNGGLKCAFDNTTPDGQEQVMSVWYFLGQHNFEKNGQDSAQSCAYHHPGDLSHEQMSVRMIDHIVDEHNIDISRDAIKRVQEMILASSEKALHNSTKEKHFLYDIVANGRNGIDVDKFDYIARDSRACGLGCSFDSQRLMETMRVLGDEICYRAKDYLTVHKLFATRADLYRTVYTHAKVKAVELMVADALVKADSYLEISSYIHDPSEYWKLDDTILKTIETAPDQELKDARDLILRIRRRDLYQFCNDYAVPKEQIDHFRNVTAQDIVCSQKSGGVTLKEEDIAVCNTKIDLTRGRQNPLDNISFYQDFSSTEKFPIADHRVSHLLPASYQDMIVGVYSKKPELFEAVSEAFENFQLKTYGTKTQVCATPDRKKRRL